MRNVFPFISSSSSLRHALLNWSCTFLILTNYQYFLQMFSLYVYIVAPSIAMSTIVPISFEFFSFNFFIPC